MNIVERHIILHKSAVIEALQRLDELAADANLFVVDDDNKLIGSLTDGDIRRGLMKGYTLDMPVAVFAKSDPKFLRKGENGIENIKLWRGNGFKIVPIIDKENYIVDIINFSNQISLLPMEAVIMAGGFGTRLLPLTENTPKPLLLVGGKPIIEYNIDRLLTYGISKITITVKYLGQQIVDKFGDGSSKKARIQYLFENEPLGTIGAVGEISDIESEYILVMNSDLLTNIDLEDMFTTLISQQGDMIVATTPYHVKVPYGIIESSDGIITELKEKPTYTYYSNAGIYMFKKEVLKYIPKGSFFNATDLMMLTIENQKKVLQFPILGYWLDIGRHEDYAKAQIDINHIRF